MKPDCINEKKNVLITPEMIVEAIYSTIESRRPRWWKGEPPRWRWGEENPRD